MAYTRTLFDSTHASLGLLSPSGIVLEASKSFLSDINVESVEEFGTSFWETPLCVNSPTFVSEFKQAIALGLHGETASVQSLSNDEDGIETHLQFTTSPMYDDENNVCALVVDISNDTGIRQTQQALAENKERFRIMNAMSRDTYWEQDELYRFVEVWRNVEGQTNPSMEVDVGKCRWDLPAPEVDELFWSAHRATLDERESFENFEYRRFGKDGEVKWISTSGEPVYDSENIFRGYRGISCDITKQKAFATESLENEMRLRLAVNIAGIGIWEWDMISDQVHWDKKQFELFGVDYVEGTIPLSTSTDVIHPDDRERLRNKAKEVLEDGSVAKEEFRVLHKDGSIHWLLGCSDVVKLDSDNTSALLVGVNMDITEAKQVELTLREHEGQLTRVNKELEARVLERTAQLQKEAQLHSVTQSQLAISRRLDSLGQLASGVAHDFNNLLAIIDGNLELAMQYGLPDESVTLIADARKAVELGVTLNNRLLSFASKQVLSPVRLSTSRRVLETVQLLERILGENIPITLSIDDDLWDTYADPYEIDSAIVNIVINARDAMPAGGKLVIEAFNFVLDAASPDIPEDVLFGEYVSLFVTDTGTGMHADVLRKAIEPFFTTKDPGKGTGLGLSSVFGFAKQSNGFLLLDSQVGNGTTVRLYLPRATGTVPSEHVSTASNNLTSTNSETVLVVEDDTMVREITVKRLRHLGYRVLEATTAKQALEMLTTGSTVDLVFTDLVMPGDMSGFELAEWVIKKRKDIGVLLTSGHKNQDGANTLMSMASNVRVLSKPYPMQLLAHRVREALEIESSEQ